MISVKEIIDLGFKVDLSKSITIVATLKMEVTVQSTLGMLLLGGLGACPQENCDLICENPA